MAKLTHDAAFIVCVTELSSFSKEKKIVVMLYPRELPQVCKLPGLYGKTMLVFTILSAFTVSLFLLGNCKYFYIYTYKYIYIYIFIYIIFINQIFKM